MKRVEVISCSEDGTYEVEAEDGPYVRWTEANYYILCVESKLKAKLDGLQLRLDNQIKQKHELKAKVEEMQAAIADFYKWWEIDFEDEQCQIMNDKLLKFLPEKER